RANDLVSGGTISLICDYAREERIGGRLGALSRFRGIHDVNGNDCSWPTRDDDRQNGRGCRFAT
ncbi:MAG: hypothetical protein JWM63_2465, partial [Gammaproteobacteria bacterium]|nr:hypothetical protein [Gammaproteobacteria bacterium]